MAAAMNAKWGRFAGGEVKMEPVDDDDTPRPPSTPPPKAKGFKASAVSVHPNVGPPPGRNKGPTPSGPPPRQRDRPSFGGAYVEAPDAMEEPPAKVARTVGNDPSMSEEYWHEEGEAEDQQAQWDDDYVEDVDGQEDYSAPEQNWFEEADAAVQHDQSAAAEEEGEYEGDDPWAVEAEPEQEQEEQPFQNDEWEKRYQMCENQLVLAETDTQQVLEMARRALSGLAEEEGSSGADGDEAGKLQRVSEYVNVQMSSLEDVQKNVIEEAAALRTAFPQGSESMQANFASLVKRVRQLQSSLRGETLKLKTKLRSVRRF